MNKLNSIKKAFIYRLICCSTCVLLVHTERKGEIHVKSKKIVDVDCKT